MSTPRVFDHEEAMERVGGDEEFLGELVAMFLEAWPRERARLQGQLKSGDVFGVSRTAHSLKGSLGNLGARASMQRALELERAGSRNDDSGTLEKLFSELLGAVDSFQELLRTEYPRLLAAAKSEAADDS